MPPRTPPPKLPAAKRHTVDLSQIGDTGLYRAGGYLFEEYLPQLRGPRGARVYREMLDGDPVIGGIMHAIESLLRRLEWRTDPADDSPDAQAIADWFEGARNDMELSWIETLSEIISFLPWGFNVMELEYKLRQGESDDPLRRSAYDDGLIGWRRWGIRAQDTLLKWEFAEDGTPTGMWQLVPYIGKMSLIPLDKCLHFRTITRKNSPEGKPILRNCYEPYYYKKNIQKLEAIAIERNGAGFPVGYIPSEYLLPGKTAEQQQSYQAFQKIVTNIRTDEQGGVLWPSDRDDQGNLLYELTFLDPGGSRTIDTDRVIERYNRDIARALQAQFMFSGTDSVGSFAAATSHQSMFARALQAWVDHICAVVKEQAYKPLLRLNGVDPALAPTLATNDIGQVDLEAFANELFQLQQASLITPDPELEAHLRKLFGLPEAMVRPGQTVEGAQAAPITEEPEEATTLGDDEPPAPALQTVPDYPAKTAAEPLTSDERLAQTIADAIEFWDRVLPGTAALLEREEAAA